MNWMQRLLCGTSLVLGTFLASQLLAQTGPREEVQDPPIGPMVLVENIELLGVVGGENNVQIPQFQFFPVGSSGAHLSLATGALVENVLNPNTTNGLWWDIDLKVTVSPNDVNTATGLPREPVMLAIDKDVYNQTRWRWTDFHMTLGMRTPAGGFMESDEFDFLFFKDNPPPMEKRGKFENPPMKDEPVAPDNLWWFANGTPGVIPGDWAQFWLGIQIPPTKFDPFTGMARIVLREHASIPEPTTLCLVGMAGMLCALRRR